MSTSELLKNQMKKTKKKQSTNLELNLDNLEPEFDVEKTINQMFRYAFITNCHLDEASVTGEELETLEELTIEEILENFKDLVNDLLNFKRDYRSTDKAELAQRSEQFENMLQKSEAEVRNHIRVEHQLKLHIEITQNKVDELEKFKADSELKILEYEEKLKNGEKTAKKELAKDMALQKLEVECNKLRSLLEEKIKECEKFKRELEKAKSPKKNEKTSASIDLLKKKIEEKAGELNKIQKFMKDSTEKPFIKVVDRKNRKSYEEVNRNTPSPFRSKKESEAIAWTDTRPSTAKKTPTRSHSRSNSDQTRPLSTKKVII